eukprot:767617-Hanusia_phi.AAC.5
MTARENSETRPLRGTGLEEETTFEYDVRLYPWKEVVGAILGVEGTPLEDLHKTEEAKAHLDEAGVKKFQQGWGPGRRENPFLRRWKRFWCRGSTIHDPLAKRFNALLRRFVKDFISPRMGDETIIYQKEPTLRVVFPSPYVPGKRHTDSEYHHQPAEVESIPAHACLCQLVVSRLFKGLGKQQPMGGIRAREGGDYNWLSAHIKSCCGLLQNDFHSLDLSYGEVCRFYGNQCLHYCEPNATNYTRVSIDLRAIPCWAATISHQRRENRKIRILRMRMRLGQRNEYDIRLDSTNAVALFSAIL